MTERDIPLQRTPPCSLHSMPHHRRVALVLISRRGQSSWMLCSTLLPSLLPSPLPRACSQEVVGDGGPRRHRLLRLRDLVEEEEIAVKVLVELEDGGNVSATVAVVGRRPDRYEVLLGEHVLEALLHKLVSAAHKLQSVHLAELRRHSGAEEPPGPSRADGPILNVLGVRPHQIAEGALVGDLLLAVDEAHLVERDDVRRQPPVHAQHAPVNHRRHVQVVEHLRAVLPCVSVPVFPLTLLVESVHLRNLPTFVVPS
mmetsp:Transcript_67384/g.140410  ORF Transcript_67384/g.140410 Transcript_67384/m.140410 type:complete len:256 (-) Transcript_67384:555-1322(-)